MATAPIEGVKALLFDVFGTVVDWRGSIIRQLEAVNQEHGLNLDASQFADDWRGLYGPYMRKVHTGELPWMNIDALHRLALKELLDKRSIAIPDALVDRMVKFWHRLDPWPDTVEGLQRLKQKYIIGTLSNGNVGLLTNMAKFAGLNWDVILSAELARKYKVDLDCYRYNVSLLGYSAECTMMVAAHSGDLKNASLVDMRTAFVQRPLEFGSYREDKLDPGGDVDIVCSGFDELASHLGV